MPRGPLAPPPLSRSLPSLPSAADGQLPCASHSTLLVRPQGFLSGDEVSANAFFAKASECFNKAVEQEPGVESYRRAKEMSAKVGGWVGGCAFFFCAPGGG